MELDRLTNSCVSCARRCLRQFYYRYILGIGRLKIGGALRIGGAFHKGAELWRKGTPADEAITAAVAGYLECPEWADVTEWSIECVTVRGLLRAYMEHYAGDQLEYVAVEVPFRLPLCNPDSFGKSRTFDWAGKIDAIVKWEGRTVLSEIKTTGDSIEPDSDYWQRLRIDPQPSGYVLASRELGYDVQSVIYDLIRKPSIRPLAIPLTDDSGTKIVLNAAGERVKTKDGRKFRETADAALGYALQTRPETPEEFEARLYQDCKDRPSHYFARREIPRLEDSLEEYKRELWQASQLILECKRHGIWIRNVSKATCTGCEYFDPCTNSIKLDINNLPPQFQVLPSLYAELEEASS
jgi:hypothetical protein